MSVVRPLPDRSNLTNLRKQAKSLLAAWRTGDQQALTRVRELHPHGDRLTAMGRQSLADAQLVVARGYGFTSWPRLVQHLRLTPNAQAGYAMDRLFQATLGPAGKPCTVGQVLDRRVEVLWRAHLDDRPGDAGLFADYLASRGHADPDVRAVRGGDDADGRGPTIDDVRGVIAHEHGFADWAAVAAHRDQPVDAHFEVAVDAIVSGDPDTLRAVLDADPALVRARSPFGHHATLVHYVAANGVESTRQWQSPRNAAQILRTLLRHGADPNAVCDTYDGGSAQTPLYLLVSSMHPAQAGVQGGLVEELCRGGANPNGLDEDGLPLWTAITYGYPAAVDALARSGARVDNLVFAAAVGDVSRVTTFLRHGRADRPGSATRVGARGPALDPDHLVEYALIYSAGLGRRAVVELLLAQDPDLTVTEPVWRSTAAGAARYHRRHDILALLEAA